MKVFLVRHGDADAEIPEGLDDAARALTTKSRHAIHDHFAALAPRMNGVQLVLTSPLVRTVQTAQLLASALGLEVPLRSHRSLLPDMPVGSIEAVLAEHPDQHVVLVGHNPSMGAMAAHLLGLHAFPKPVSPGTVIALERSEHSGHAHLLFYAPPGHPAAEQLAV